MLSLNAWPRPCAIAAAAAAAATPGWGPWWGGGGGGGGRGGWGDGRQLPMGPSVDVFLSWGQMLCGLSFGILPYRENEYNAVSHIIVI